MSQTSNERGSRRRARSPDPGPDAGGESRDQRETRLPKARRTASTSSPAAASTVLSAATFTGGTNNRYKEWLELVTPDGTPSYASFVGDGGSMTSAMATSGREKFRASLKDFVLRTLEPRRRTRFSPQKVGPSRLSGAMILTRLSRLRTCRPCWSQAARHRSLPLVSGVAPNRRELLGDMSLPPPPPPIPRPHLCPISPSSTVLPPLPVTS